MKIKLNLQGDLASFLGPNGFGCGGYGYGFGNGDGCGFGCGYGYSFYHFNEETKELGDESKT